MREIHAVAGLRHSAKQTLSVTFEVDKIRLFLSVSNQSADSIVIRLNDGQFIDANNRDGSLYRAAGLDETPSPLPLPNGESSSVGVYPSFTVKGTEPIFSPQTIWHPSPARGMISNERLRHSAETGSVGSNLGDSYSLILPIDVENTVYEYKFTFEIRNAVIGRGSQRISLKQNSKDP